MIWVFLICVAVALVAVVGALAAGRLPWDPLSEPTRTRPDTRLPVVPSAEDVAGVRFDTAARGYRMDQVDDVLARLAARLAEQEDEIARLGGGRAVRPAPDDGGPAGGVSESGGPAWPSP